MMIRVMNGDKDDGDGADTDGVILLKSSGN